MTDGEDKETDPLTAAQEVADEGVLIYTIGFGTPDGEPIPEVNQYGETVAYKTDAQGNVVLSSLDETTLQTIAQTGGGEYYRATAGGQELDSLLSQIDQLQQAQLQSRFETRYIERYQIFLALALAALVAAGSWAQAIAISTIAGRSWIRTNGSIASAMASVLDVNAASRLPLASLNSAMPGRGLPPSMLTWR